MFQTVETGIWGSFGDYVDLIIAQCVQLNQNNEAA